MKFKKVLIATATSAAMALAATSSYAALVLDGPIAVSGAGLGTVHTILGIQSPGGGSFESGGVGVHQSVAGIILTGDAIALTGDAKPYSTVKSFSTLGISDASELRVIFNAVEPAQDSITLESLVLNVYTPGGFNLFSTSYEGVPHTFTDSFSGTGTAGYAFSLDAGSASQLQTLLGDVGSQNYLVGLSASASSATGGPDTFYVASANTVSPIPEPESYAMMLAGLGLMGFMARRRSKKQV